MCVCAGGRIAALLHQLLAQRHRVDASVRGTRLEMGILMSACDFLLGNMIMINQIYSRIQAELRASRLHTSNISNLQRSRIKGIIGCTGKNI